LKLDEPNVNVLDGDVAVAVQLESPCVRRKAIPDILVLSEPAIFGRLIREARWSGVPVHDEQRSALVRGFLGAMLKENPASNIVVKCSSVSTITLDQTLRYMPPVPWCFLSRTPADVIASLQASPGMWLRTPAVREHTMRQIGRDSPRSGHAERSRDLYAYLLEHFYLAVMKRANEYATFLDYSDFNIDNVCEVVAQTLHRAVDSSMRQAISASLQVYSKGVTPRPFCQPKAFARHLAILSWTRCTSDTAPLRSLSIHGAGRETYLSPDILRGVFVYSRHNQFEAMACEVAYRSRNCATREPVAV
jgi:hypothetical protein